MKQNLDTLRSEIERYLETEGFVVFHGFSRLSEMGPLVEWDTERYPDYRRFLQTAQQAGVKMIVYHYGTFSGDPLDESDDRLQISELPREEKRTLERRIRELRAYEGFTCTLEISFDYNGRVYVYDLRTEWYDELLDIMEMLDDSMPADEPEDENPMGGYFSRN